jgi:hypothetical protein
MMRIFPGNSGERERTANPGSRGRATRCIANVGFVVGLVLLAPVRPALAEERCGWLENPTPGNWWLKDAHALLVISAQGGPYAEGVEKLPEPAPDRFVATNGHYGYSCACVSGTFDEHAERVTQVDATRALPLSVCRSDKALPAPGGAS